MTYTADARFTKGSLMWHVSAMSFTTSIALMAIYAVDLLDLLFISRLGYEQMAAAGYAGALMFFGSAFNIGLSVAAGALVSRELGAGNVDAARDYATSVAVRAVFVGIVLPLAVLPNLTFLLGLVGATGGSLALAKTYMWIILPATAFSGLSMTAVAVIRAHGDGRTAMYPTLAGAGVNAVMDPVLIFALGLGLEGAAWATVLARLATMLWALYPAIWRYNAFSWPRLRVLKRDFNQSARIAVPAILAAVATPIGTAIITREMAKYGTGAVAGMTVINRMTPVVFAVVLALSGAIGPIIGQNFGARRPDRVRESFFDGLVFVAVYVVVAAALLFGLRAPIAEVFGATGEAHALIYLYCGPLALAMFFNGAIYVANAAFNNLGHPAYSTLVDLGRNTLGTWPLAVLGGAYFGPEGVLIGQAAGGALFAACATWLALHVIRGPATGIIKRPHFRFYDRRMMALCHRCNR